MAKSRLFRKFASCVGALLKSPRPSAYDLANLADRVRGFEVEQRWKPGPSIRNESVAAPAAAANPLREYFDGVREGPGIWKWLHYFEIYHRHLAKFIGRPVTVVEVGVYSGGSMPMWHHYFGPNCRVHGVDIQPECKAYEDEATTIHIGDQSDRAFWRRFRERVPRVDVVIDDGGHEPEQQTVTLEEMLPHVNPGGVYVCEDIHGVHNSFASFVQTLSGGLNAAVPGAASGAMRNVPTPFQAAVHSVHLYPYVVVVERRDAALDELVAPKHGTKWQPFL